MYALLNPELRLKDNLAWLQYFRNSVVFKIFKHIPLKLKYLLSIAYVSNP